MQIKSRHFLELPPGLIITNWVSTVIQIFHTYCSKYFPPPTVNIHMKSQIILFAKSIPSLGMCSLPGGADPLPHALPVLLKRQHEWHGIRGEGSWCRKKLGRTASSAVILAPSISHRVSDPALVSSPVLWCAMSSACPSHFQSVQNELDLIMAVTANWPRSGVGTVKDSGPK